MPFAPRTLLTVCMLALVPHCATAATLDFPTRPIRIIEPYAAGGPSDTGARLAAEALGRQLGQSVIVENRGGGGGLNGTEAYLHEKPDGYTLLVGSIGPFAIMPAAKTVHYDPLTDFVPLGLVWQSALTLAVRPSLGVKSMADFIAYAKAHPGNVTIGSAGTGSITHLAIELLKGEAKINVIHVPFRSTSESLPALMGGQIDALFGDTPIIAPQIKAGQITAVAVADTSREASLPSVPTMAEAGLPGVIAGSWFGLVVSSKVPAPIVKRLQEAMIAAQKDPKYEASLVKQGATIGKPGPGYYADLIKSDAAKWRGVITAAGIRLD